jgi:hypothetical protein
MFYWVSGKIVKPGARMYKTIKTEDLTINDLPNANADWDELSEFALSFNSQLDLGTTDIYKISNTKFDNKSTLQELRLSLFLWQRALNNMSGAIDDKELEKLQNIVELIRIKLAQ